MRILLLLLIVSISIACAKYIPHEASETGLLFRYKRSDSNESELAKEDRSVNDSETDADDDDDDDSSQKSVQEKLNEKLLENERKLQEKQAKKERELREKLEKEERKRQVKLEKDERKRHEKIEKEEQKRQQHIEKEKRKLEDRQRKIEYNTRIEELKRQEQILKQLNELKNDFTDDDTAEDDFLETEEDNSIEFEDIWRRHIYGKYGLTFSSTTVEKQAALDKYLTQELGLSRNSTKAERRDAIVKAIDAKLKTDPASRDALKKQIYSQTNLVAIQNLRNKLETDIEELNNKTQFLDNNATMRFSNLSFTWIPEVKQNITNVKTFLETIVKFLSDLLPNETKEDQTLNNTINSSTDANKSNADVSNVVTENNQVINKNIEARPTALNGYQSLTSVQNKNVNNGDVTEPTNSISTQNILSSTQSLSTGFDVTTSGLIENAKGSSSKDNTENTKVLSSIDSNSPMDNKSEQNIGSLDNNVDSKDVTISPATDAVFNNNGLSTNNVTLPEIPKSDSLSTDSVIPSKTLTKPAFIEESINIAEVVISENRKGLFPDSNNSLTAKDNKNINENSPNQKVNNVIEERDLNASGITKHIEILSPESDYVANTVPISEVNNNTSLLLGSTNVVESNNVNNVVAGNENIKTPSLEQESNNIVITPVINNKNNTPIQDVVVTEEVNNTKIILPEQITSTQYTTKVLEEQDIITAVPETSATSNMDSTIGYQDTSVNIINNVIRTTGSPIGENNISNTDVNTSPIIIDTSTNVPESSKVVNDGTVGETVTDKSTSNKNISNVVTDTIALEPVINETNKIEAAPSITGLTNNNVNGTNLPSNINTETSTANNNVSDNGPTVTENGNSVFVSTSELTTISNLYSTGEQSVNIITENNVSISSTTDTGIVVELSTSSNDLVENSNITPEQVASDVLTSKDTNVPTAANETAQMTDSTQSIIVQTEVLINGGIMVTEPAVVDTSSITDLVGTMPQQTVDSTVNVNSTTENILNEGITIPSEPGAAVVEIITQ